MKLENKNEACYMNWERELYEFHWLKRSEDDWLEQFLGFLDSCWTIGKEATAEEENTIGCIILYDRSGESKGNGMNQSRANVEPGQYL